MYQMSSVVDPRATLPERPGTQLRYDVFFGIALPIICFIFDPIVFRGFMGGDGLLGTQVIFGTVFAATQMVLLATWLIAGPSLERWAAPVSGFLFFGALGSLILGILLFPVSVVGIPLFGVGLLGFTPLFTACVFFKNAMRAARVAWGERPRSVIVAGLIGGVVLGFVIPTEADRIWNDEIQKSISRLDSADHQQRHQAVRNLRRFRPLLRTDLIVWKYHNERDGERRMRLSAAYRQLTGYDIDQRLRYLWD